MKGLVASILKQQKKKASENDDDTANEQGLAEVANIFATLVNGNNDAKGKKVTIGAATAEAPPAMEEDGKISEELAMATAVKLNGMLCRGKKKGGT